MGKQPMNKKIPQNTKYKHVQSTLDTGSSINKYMRRIEDIRQNYKFRKDEIFKRMKVTTFIQLVIQVQRLEQEFAMIAATPATEDQEGADQELRYLTEDNGQQNNGQVASYSPVPSLAVTEGDYGRTASCASGPISTNRSTFLSVSRGMGELDMNKQPSAPPTESNDFVDDLSPYLLLDVRDRDDYDLCHIISALSYPKAQLSKATNYESKEMLQYKNKEGVIIVLYDEDERLAPKCAETLVQRGYDNIFMLSGGMKVASRIFPDGLVTGTLPPTITPQPKRVVPASELNQLQFTSDDVNKMEMYLDTALGDHSSGDSRCSSTRSTRSAATSASAKSGKVWK